jgi:Plasmid pRiA4b ORF-3-like protein
MVYQIKISLKDIRPEIWRRIQIDSETSFYEMHHIIQIVMDWWNYHLYQFVISNPFNRSRIRIGNPELLDDSEALVDRSTLISSILANEKDTLNYEYDFGDSWKHLIKLEKIIQIGKIAHPKCIDGKRNTPPEDCGGVPGFYNFIEIMSDKKNKEYKSTKKWYGGDYDPDFIDIQKINQNLENIADYIKEYEKDWEI